MNKILHCISFYICIAYNSYAAENICGWIDNPSPSNYWITDRSGIIYISQQGGFQANGVEKIKPYISGQFVNKNNGYGYYCGCLLVDIDKARNRVIEVYGFKQKHLSVCMNDKNIK